MPETPENIMEITPCSYCGHLLFSMEAMKKKLAKIFH